MSEPVQSEQYPIEIEGPDREIETEPVGHEDEEANTDGEQS